MAKPARHALTLGSSRPWQLVVAISLVTVTGGCGKSDGGSPGTGGTAGTVGSGGSDTGGTIGSGGQSGGGSTTVGTGGKTGTGGRADTGGKPGSGGATGDGGSSKAAGTGGAKSGGAAGASTPVGHGGAAGVVGSGGLPGGGGGMGGTTSTLLNKVVSSFCTAARTCCASAGYPADSLANCEADFPLHQPAAYLFDMKQVSFNTASGSGCGAMYDMAAKMCSNISQLATNCSGLFVGLQADGQPCGKGANIPIPGALACRKTGGGPEACLWPPGDVTKPEAAGVCMKVPRGKAGDPCVSSCPTTSVDCSFDKVAAGADDQLVTLCFEDEKLYCSRLTSPPTCAPIVAQGESCAADPAACDSASYCDSASQTCKAAVASGQSCAAAPCAPPLVCGANNKCGNPPMASERTCQGYPPMLQ